MRRGGDSNPRSACTDNGFQDRRIQPLCHLSEKKRGIKKAVGGGFEPPEPLRAQRFSRPPRSTTPASHRLLERHKDKVFSGTKSSIILRECRSPLFHLLRTVQRNNQAFSVAFSKQKSVEPVQNHRFGPVGIDQIAFCLAKQGLTA